MPPALSRGPYEKEMDPLSGVVEQERDLVRALVGDHKVGKRAGEVEATVMPTGFVPTK